VTEKTINRDAKTMDISDISDVYAETMWTMLYAKNEEQKIECLMDAMQLFYKFIILQATQKPKESFTYSPIIQTQPYIADKITCETPMEKVPPVSTIISR